jgi:hypothetical protein
VVPAAEHPPGPEGLPHQGIQQPLLIRPHPVRLSRGDDLGGREPPVTTRTLAQMFGLVAASGCQRMLTSSSESSTTSARSVPATTMAAPGPNSAPASRPGATSTPSPVTTSRSTSDSSCQVPVLTEPNTAIARTRPSCR